MRTIQLAAAIAAIGLTVGLATACAATSPAVTEQANADTFLFGQLWDVHTPEGQQAACDAWSADRIAAYNFWATHGVNADGITTLAALLDSRCSLAV